MYFLCILLLYLAFVCLSAFEPLWWKYIQSDLFPIPMLPPHTNKRCCRPECLENCDKRNNLSRKRHWLDTQTQCVCSTQLAAIVPKSEEKTREIRFIFYESTRRKASFVFTCECSNYFSNCIIHLSPQSWICRD